MSKWDVPVTITVEAETSDEAWELVAGGMPPELGTDYAPDSNIGEPIQVQE